MNTKPKRVLLANPRGFCAGVERAIDAVERALELYSAPVYVRRAIVHNHNVVQRLERLGAVFVQEIDEIPQGSVAILSAHGSPKSIKIASDLRGLHVIDAICPLVAKVHSEVEKWYRSGRHILLIGHQGHPEIVGTLGQVPQGSISVISSSADLAGLALPRNTAVAYVTQTTFSVEDSALLIADIVSRFDDVAGPRSDDICYATTNRQNSIRAIALISDHVIVAGDPTSSNAQRLVETAKAAGCRFVHLVSDAAQIPLSTITNASTIGLTAAASTPDTIIDDICQTLAARGFVLEEAEGKIERVKFRDIVLTPRLGAETQDTSFSDHLERLKQDLDDLLERSIAHDSTSADRLSDAMRYAVVGGGKRFRAMLCWAVSDLLGAKYENSLRVAAAIECVHAQSLIHDDLPCMDDDDVRRGRPTVHIRYDEATAVLAGDALLALAFELLAHPDTCSDSDVRANLVLELAKTIGQAGLAGGQVMDLFPPAQPTLDEVFECERRKTGALIRFAVEAGALLGKCSNADRAALLEYADNVGLLFQIRDDILDEVGSAELMGKKVGKDSQAGRASVTTVFDLSRAKREAVRIENSCYASLEKFGRPSKYLEQIAHFAASRMY